MKIVIQILVVGFLVLSCTSNTIYEKPKDLIAKDQMVDLITDLLIATGAKNFKNLDQKTKINYYQLVYDKYGIDSTRFKASNLYYTSRIDDYNAIFFQVEERLKSLRDEFDRDRMMMDSLNHINGEVRPEDFD